MAELDGKKSAANNIFGIFRRISKKDKEKETVKSPKIKQEMIQGQTAPKRKISSKRSLAIPPFEASLDWDTGRLFMPPEDEHIDTEKSSSNEIRYRKTSDRLFADRQAQQQQQQQQQQNSTTNYYSENNEKKTTIMGLENRLFHDRELMTANNEQKQKTADQTEKNDELTVETVAVSHPTGTVQREDKQLEYLLYDAGILATNALPTFSQETVDSTASPTAIEESEKLSTSSSSFVGNTTTASNSRYQRTTTSFDNRPNLSEKEKINPGVEYRNQTIAGMENSWNQISKVNVLYTTNSGSPKTGKLSDFRKKVPRSSPKDDSKLEKVGYKESQRFSTIAVGRSDKDNVRGTVKSVFENGDRKVENLSTVKMRGQDGCFGPVSRARSVLILSNIDNVDDSLKPSDYKNSISPNSMNRYEPKIRVSCFEDEYYENETLKDDEYLHTIKFGYSDVNRKKAPRNVYSTPPNNLVIVHPSTLRTTPDANNNRKYRRNVDSNRRKTTEIFATLSTPPPSTVDVKQQQPTSLAKPICNENRTTKLLKMSSSMSNLRVGESEKTTIRKNDYESKTENAKSVESKENRENENEEDIMDVGRMLHKQRLEKEYEILNTLVKQWQDYSKRNEQKIKKDGTLTMRDLTQSQQLQTAMMEQQKTIERLLLAPKSEPIPTFPTTPEPPKPSIDTDSLVYKAGPTPYRSVYSSNGNIEKMEDSRIGDLSPNRPFFELSSSRKSSINPTASLVGDPNSVEIQIPVRRTSRSFYNEFSRGQSPMTLNDQRRRDSSSCDYKSTVGAATAPTTTLPPGDVWDYGANGRLGKNEILKPSQLFAYSAKKHENDDVLSTGRPHSPRPTAAQRTGRRPASEDSDAASCPAQTWRPLSSQSPSGAASTTGRYSSVYQSSSQYFSSLAGRHPTPAAASDTESKKFYFKNYYAPAAAEPSPTTTTTVKKPEETWREGHTRLMRELRDLNKF